MRRRLENVLTGAGTARMELLKRRAAGMDRSPGGGGGSGSGGAGGDATSTGMRFDKDTWFQSVNDAQNAEARHRGGDDVGNDAHIEGEEWMVIVNNFNCRIILNKRPGRF